MVDPTPRPRLVVKPDQAQKRSSPPPPSEGHHPPSFVVDSVVSEPLRSVIDSRPDELVGVVIELRVVQDVESARRALARLLTAVTSGREIVPAGRSPYVTVALTGNEIADLATRAAAVRVRRKAAEQPTASVSSPAPRSVIQRMWPNFEITGQLLRSA